MQSSPTTSLIITTKDRAHFVPDAIRSALATAARVASWSDTEIIVVDDGSTDDTPRVVSQFPVTFIPNRGHRLAEARNTGFSAARGRFVGFLDDDDVLLENHLELHLRAHDRDHRAGLSYSQGMLADVDLHPVMGPFPRGPLPGGMVQRYVFSAHMMQVNTLLIERSLFERSGGFDPVLESGEDLDFVQKVCPMTEFVPIEQVTTFWRLHKRAGSGSYARWQRNRLTARENYERGLRYIGPSAIPLHQRLARRMKNRGWAAFDAKQEADRCLDHGHRLEAARLLLGALRVSPAHACFKVGGFWSTGARLFRNRPV